MNMYLWQCSALIWTDSEVTLANSYRLFALYYEEKDVLVVCSVKKKYVYKYVKW
jgi:hypothetical protein